MSTPVEVSDLFAQLQLRPDADERDVRRAYARQLKALDPETQPQEFQQLRENYEQLIGWLRHRQRQEAEAAAQAAAQAEVEGASAPEPASAPSAGAAANATDATIDAETGAPPSVPSDAPSPQPQAPADAPHADAGATAAAAAPPTGEALGHEMLGVLIHRLTEQPFRDRDEVRAFLRDCLDDERLAHLDARQYFEWGVASILAQGWRPGHELLFMPAVETFHWQQDRSRLAWLARPGQILDAALAEIAAYDTQSDQHRAAQRDAIRATRNEARPSERELLRQLPVAEYVANNFPHWLHVIGRHDSLPQWREWDATIPAWRRRLLRGTGARPPADDARAPVAAKSGGTHWAWGLALFLVFCVALNIANDNSKAARNAPGDLPTQSLRVNPDTLQFSREIQQMQSALRLKSMEHIPTTASAAERPGAALGPAQLREALDTLVRVRPVMAASCDRVFALVLQNLPAHRRSELAPQVDDYIVNCLLAQQNSWIDRDVTEPAIGRHKHGLGTQLLGDKRP